MSPRGGNRALLVGVAAIAAILGAAAFASAGSTGYRLLKGTTQADTINGGPTADRIYGFGGNDRLAGKNGNDLLVGGAGRDALSGGAGNDKIHARDGGADTVSCGPGVDTVAVDRVDTVSRDCERRNLDLRSLPPAPTHPATRPTPGPVVGLTVRVVGQGRVTSSPAGIDCPGRCNADFGKGMHVTLTATAAAGTSFSAWGARCRGTGPTCTLVLNERSWARASFGDGPTTPPPPSPPPSPPSPPSGNSIVLENRSWTCRGPVNLDLVRVTMRTGGGDAIYLREGCTGRIGRIEVQTWVADGLKINAPEPAAHDLVIEGGYIRCYDKRAGVHQDGIQAMSGTRITLRNLEVNCNSTPNAQLFINAANGGKPTDIVCDGCTLGKGGAHSLLVMSSTRSGARNTVICEARYHDIRIGNATSPVNVNNTVVPTSDPRCTAPAP